MKDLTVLITAAGSPSSPGLISCLKNNGERKIRIIGVDMKNDPTIQQLVDVVRIVPSVRASNYVDELLKVCIDEKVDVLIPGISQELEVLQARKSEFESKGIKVSVSDGEGLSIANDKIRLYKYMKSRGIRVPEFEIVNDKEKFVEVCKKIGYPNKSVCVKIKDGSGSRGVRIIDPTKSRYDIFVNEKPNSLYTTIEEMVTILNETDSIPELLVMQNIPGKEYSVDLLADHGKVLYMVGRESNVVLASIPQEATLTKNEEAYDIAERLVNMLKLDGNIDIDFKFDENGIPQLLEINPRLAATLSVITAGGVNLLYLRVKQLLGEKLPKVEVNYGVKLKRRYHELFCDKNGRKITI